MINSFSSYLCLLDPGYDFLLSPIGKEIQECCFSGYRRFGCGDPLLICALPFYSPLSCRSVSDFWPDVKKTPIHYFLPLITSVNARGIA